MFGYIQVDKDELKVRDYNLFKSYYCGVCQTLKKEFGFPARYFLSYDVTFLAVLLSALQEEMPKVCPQRCLANPMIRRPVAQKNPVLSYAAAVNVLLVWFKLKDDWADNHSLKSLLIMPGMLTKKNKSRKAYPALYEKIGNALSELSQSEKQGCDQPDQVAASFGKLMEDIFDTTLIKPKEQRRILAHMGFLLGRIIYLLDAWADREDDRKKKAYNPFLLSQIPEEDVRLSMDYTLSELANSFALLDIKHNKEILENIIYLGLKRKADAVFAGNKTKENHHERPL